MTYPCHHQTFSRCRSKARDHAQTTSRWSVSGQPSLTQLQKVRGLAHRLTHRPQFSHGKLDIGGSFSFLKIFDLLLTTRTSTKPVCENPPPPDSPSSSPLCKPLFFFILLSLTSVVSAINSQDGCPQVRRRASEEEAVGCRCLPPPSSLLGSTLNHQEYAQAQTSIPHVDGGFNLLSLSCSPLELSEAVEFFVGVLNTPHWEENSQRRNQHTNCVRLDTDEREPETKQAVY